MAKITATFERYFQYKAYEGEKIVLSVEEDVGEADPVVKVEMLHRRLAEIGDEITAQRLGKHHESDKPRPPAFPSQSPTGPSQDKKDW